MKWVAFIAILFWIPAIASAAGVPSCVLSTPPGTVQPGTNARLIWYTENATKASIASIGTVQLQGYMDVRPTKTTTYVMTVSNGTASKTCAVIVNVAPSQQSLLYYNSPQPYVYSPNQLFWAPIYVPPRYVNGNYVITDSWYEDTPGIHDIDSGYIPGSSYTLTTSYYLPNGDQYDVHEHCVAGIDCITVGSMYSWTEEPIRSEPVSTILTAPPSETTTIFEPVSEPTSELIDTPLFGQYPQNNTIFIDSTPVPGLPGVHLNGTRNNYENFDNCATFPMNPYCAMTRPAEEPQPVEEYPPAYSPTVPQDVLYQTEKRPEDYVSEEF